METRRLGHSGIEVSALSLGTMMFGGWGQTGPEQCKRMVDIALEAGITLLDTADMYDAGVSETILGEALKGRRDRVVLATKVGNPMDGDMVRSGLSRRWITQACEDSLRRLQVDHIDLYQMHRPDPSTPIEETLGVLGELVEAGKIGATGTSTFSASQLTDMQKAAAGLGVAVPTSEQPPYSALARGIEAEVLPVCRTYDIGVIVWAPLNGGWLTGKYQTDTDDPENRANRNGEHFDFKDADARAAKRSAVERLSKVAADTGLTLKQLALGFVLDDPTITSAIIGPRTPEQLEDLLANGAPKLPEGVRDAIDAIVRPGTNLNPHDAG